MWLRYAQKLTRPSLNAVFKPSTAAPFSTAAEPELTGPVPPSAPANVYRTETDVTAHSDADQGKFYTIPADDKRQLFLHGGLPKSFELQAKTFAETCLLVRQPALELMKYMQHTSVERPALRCVLYGENGAGKSLVMAHLLHYGLRNKYLLVHVPWAPNWMRRPKETANVSTEEGKEIIDLPFDAAAWLLHFKMQNSVLLNELELKTSRDYVWSKRESTPAGSTLLELLEHGIARVKFASGTVAALLTEIKEQSTAGRCKTLVAIDGFNAFFHPYTRILTDNKKKVRPDQLTLTQPFLDITKHDWTNGFCVVTADKLAMSDSYRDSHLPRYLLRKEGFEHLDPFVPVRVDNYTLKEFSNCINYYLDRRWIQRTPKGFEEQLLHLSSMNPYTLMRQTASL